MDRDPALPSDFEWAALQELFKQNGFDVPERGKFIIRSREHTGVGFYTELEVNGSSTQIGSTKTFVSVQANVEGVAFGVTFVLYPNHDDTMLLEGVCNGNVELPKYPGLPVFLR